MTVRSTREQQYESPPAVIRTVPTDEGVLLDCASSLLAILEVSNEPIIITDVGDGTVLYANRAVSGFFGVPPASLIGRRAWEFYQDPSVRVELLTELDTQGEVRGREVALRDASGRDRWTSISMRRLRFEGRPAVVTSVLDLTELREAHDSLRLKDRRFRDLVEAAPDGIVLINKSGRIVLSNRAFDRLFGYPSGELVGSLIELLIPDGYWKRRAEAEPETGAVQLRVGAGLPVTGLRKNGVGFPVDITLSSMTGGDDDMLIAAVRDVSERRQLEDRSHLFDTALQSSINAVFSTDPDGKITFANPSFMRMWAIEGGVEDVVGRSIAEFFNDPKIVSEIQAPLDPWEGDVTCVGQRGHSFDGHLAATAAWSGTGKLLGVIGFVVDISERVRIRAELQNQAERIRDAQRVGRSGSWGWNMETDRFYGSEELDEIVGGEWEKPIDTLADFLERLNEEDRDYVTRLLDTARETGESFRGDVRPLPAGGNHCWISLAGEVVQGPDHAMAHVIGTITDVTERKEMELRLQRTAKMEAVGRLAGGVAHDFNNLLSVILTECYLLLKRKDHLDEELQSGLNAIRDVANRGAGLTRELLAYSRQQDLQPKLIRFNDALAKMERLLMRLVGERVQIELKLDADVECIHADPSQVEQVVINLVANARDAMLPDGGTISVRTENRLVAGGDADTLTVPPGRYAVLSVADEGTGIAPELLSNIFDPFFTTKEEGHGTGLGLATVFGVVSQSGGYVTVESEVGSGTTFRVFIPLADETSVAEQSPAVKLEEPESGGEMILLLEDDEALQNVVRKMLVSRGYHVTAVDSIAAALDVIRDEGDEIDLLLADVVLGDGTGIAAAKQLREEGCEVAVLLMSGYSPELVLPEEDLSKWNFLTKPFTANRLSGRVREALADPRTCGGVRSH